MADAHAPSEDSRREEGSRFRGDTTIVRSTHGTEAVRQVTCVSNDIAVHALEVDVLPGSLPLSEIALVTGFAAQIHFTRVFRHVERVD
jgi:AraC-like DNA-binding protein